MAGADFNAVTKARFSTAHRAGPGVLVGGTEAVDAIAAFFDVASIYRSAAEGPGCHQGTGGTTAVASQEIAVVALLGAVNQAVATDGPSGLRKMNS